MSQILTAALLFSSLLPSLPHHSLAGDESDECFFGEAEEGVCRDEWRKRVRMREKGECYKSYEVRRGAVAGE